MGKHDNDAAAAGKRKLPSDDNAVVDESAKKTRVEPAPAPVSVDFPRGKASSHAGSAAAATTANSSTGHESENLFTIRDDADRAVAKRKKAKKAANKEKEKKENAIKRAKVEEDKGIPRFVETLNFNKLKVGMQVLGAVREINELDLVVSLPNGLAGYVSLAEVSDVMSDRVAEFVAQAETDADNDSSHELPRLSDMFVVGQLLRSVIVRLETEGANRRIDLTLRASVVNRGWSSESVLPGMVMYGAVKSIEDRGYVINFGINDFSGFLSFKNAHASAHLPSTASADARLIIGQPLDVLIEKRTNLRLVSVIADPAKVRKCVAGKDSETSSLSLSSVQPGLLVAGTVFRILESGLVIRFLDLFYGSVDLLHLSEPGSSDWQSKYEEGQAVTARVVFVSQAAKRISLSLRPHIVSGQGFAPLATASSFKTGDRVNARVIRVDNGLGLLTELTLENAIEHTPAENTKKSSKTESTLYGYCHISHAADEKVEHLNQKFAVGTVHSARVLFTHALDGVFNVSMRASVLAQTVLAAEDLHAGDTVEGEVTQVVDAGLVVRITPRLSALCPVAHWADVAPSSAQAKKKAAARFPIGSRQTFRVLEVKLDTRPRSVKLTAKKTLLSSDLPRITSFDQAQPGVCTHGVVTGFATYGVFIGFYGGVQALLSLAELQRAGVTEAPTALFSMHQVLKVRVVSCDVERRRIVVCEASAPVRDAKTKSITSEQSSKHKAGEVVRGAKIVGIEGEGDAAVVQVDLSDGERAHLPVAHLSDHSATAASLLPVYRTRVGSTIETAVVVSVVRGVPQLTVKPLLVAAMSSKDASEWPAVPSSVDEMRAGQLLLGTIKRAESYGVFVAFADQCIALAAKAQLSDQYVSDPTEVFTVGQTVLAVVLSIEDEKDSKRVQLTLKPSQCLPLASAALVTLFAESYFSEQDQIDERSAKKSAKSIQWSNFAFGARVKGAVDEIKDYGAILSLSQDVTGFVATAHFDKQPVVKAQVEARVLDISRAKNIVDVSMKSELLDASVPSDQTAAITDANKSAKKAKKATESLRVGDSVSVVVQLVKQDYVVLTLPRHRQAVAFAMAYGLNLRTHSHTLFAVGQEYTATVARVPSAGQRLLVSLNLVERVSQPDAKSKLVKAEKKATFHDSKITSRDQLVAGVSIQVVISAVESMYMVASVGDHTNVLARISRTEVDDARLKACGYAADREGSLDKKFTVGQKLTARVISAQFKSTPGPLFVELSLRADGDAPTALISSTRSVRQSIDWDTIKIDDAQALLDFDSVQVGQRVRGWVARVESDINDENADSALVVALRPNFQGRVHLLDISDDLEALASFGEHFEVGQQVDCVVRSVNAAKRGLNLSIKHHQLSVQLEQSAAADKKQKKDKKKTAAPTDVFEASLAVGRVVAAQIMRTDPQRGLLLRFSKSNMGRAHITDLCDDAVLRPLRRFKVGQLVLARVEEISQPPKSADEDDAKSFRSEHFVSLRPSRVDPQHVASSGPQLPSVSSFASLKEDSVVAGFVKMASARGVYVWLGRNVQAYIRVADLSDGFIKDPEQAFPAGRLVMGRIIALNAATQQCQLSLKKSVVLPQSAQIKFDSLKIDQVVTARVHKIETFGVFLNIENSLIRGLAHRSEITDDKSVDLREYYEVGDRVRAKVLKLDEKKRRVSLGMKAEYLADAAEDESEEEEDEDAKRAKWTPEEKFAHALYQMLDAEDEKAALKAKLAAAGKTVFEDSDESSSDNESDGDASEEDSEEDDEEGDDQDMPDADSSDEQEDSDEQMDDDSEEVDDEEEEEEESEEESEEEEQVELKHKPAKKRDEYVKSKHTDDEVPELAVDMSTITKASKTKSGAVTATSVVPQKVSLAVEAASDSDSDSEEIDDEDEGAVAQKKKSAAAKRAARKREEQATREREQELLDEERAPSSADDFDRLLLASPNNSFLWIKYMEFQLSITEIERARQVAERAIQTIAMREEQEKLNVWIAYLNLEHLYGTADSSKKVFARAIQYCDAETVYFQMARIYERTKPAAAEELYSQMIKKFKHNPKVWLQFATFRMSKNNDRDGARALLQRALQLLDKQEHVALTTKFAVMEFKHGDSEYARTLFESLLANYPKRTDVWSVYLDQELKLNQQPVIRRLFERCITSKVKPQQMKMFFKRYLQYEKDCGDDESVELVKQKAREYVASKAAV